MADDKQVLMWKWVAGILAAMLMTSIATAFAVGADRGTVGQQVIEHERRIGDLETKQNAFQADVINRLSRIETLLERRANGVGFATPPTGAQEADHAL